jgi:hypothetical protein
MTYGCEIGRAVLHDVPLLEGCPGFGTRHSLLPFCAHDFSILPIFIFSSSSKQVSGPFVLFSFASTAPSPHPLELKVSPRYVGWHLKRVIDAAAGWIYSTDVHKQRTWSPSAHVSGGHLVSFSRTLHSSPML